MASGYGRGKPVGIGNQNAGFDGGEFRSHQQAQRSFNQGGFGTNISEGFNTDSNPRGFAEQNRGPNTGYESGAGSGRCRQCGKMGHLARQCPNSNNSKDSSDRGRNGCYNCGEEGHMSRDCPKKQESDGPSRIGGYRANDNRGGFGAVNNKETDRPPRTGGFGVSSIGGGFGAGQAQLKSDREFGSNSGGFGGFDTNIGGARGFGSGLGSGGGGGARNCHGCGEEGHVQRECPKKTTGGRIGCYNCGQDGHISRDCPSSGKERGSSAGGFGMNKSGQGGDGRECHKCGQEGHFARECPQSDAAGDRPPASTYVPRDVKVDELYGDRIQQGHMFNKFFDAQINVTSGSADINIETIKINNFENANLTATLKENVRRAGYTQPTPIQQIAIPLIGMGKDIMACAQTGSGKTAAFLLPILSQLISDDDCSSTAGNDGQSPRCIVIAPTRELAQQIFNEGRKFANGTPAQFSIVYGGTSTQYQRQQLRGCTVLVATPGRLLDFIDRGYVKLEKVRYLILDEADRMLDMGFEGDVRRLVSGTGMPDKEARVTLMFSATFQPPVQTLAREFLRNNYAFIKIGIIGSANDCVIQQFLEVSDSEKKSKLCELLQIDLSNYNVAGSEIFEKKTIVFVKMKRTADVVATLLSQAGIKSTSIHGDRGQEERETALNDFKRGHCSALIATSVASRGLDIRGIDHVINFDLPDEIDDYVHRIGRTGRVGNMGRATSFYYSSVDAKIAAGLVQILSDVQQEIPKFIAQDAGLDTEDRGYGGMTASNYGSAFGNDDTAAHW